MVQESVFRGIIEFFAKVGVYDVVLPFLLVFTIVFAILEKTKIFGTEKVGDDVYTKKNLNAMVAFVVGFLVVASTRLVAIVNNAMANIAILLIVIVCFLMLIGTFYSEKEEVTLTGTWKTVFMVIMALGVLLVFLNALGWLSPFFNYIRRYWHTNFVGAILLLLLIIVFMVWITKGKPLGSESKGSEEKKGD
ncbi:hypothetical protein KY337_00815 [Candidatus Woesearchaeota archaeon]|nr:hypothetical protein [Candidatus Woesearchaeota archaeon]